MVPSITYSYSPFSPLIDRICGKSGSSSGGTSGNEAVDEFVVLQKGTVRLGRETNVMAFTRSKRTKTRSMMSSIKFMVVRTEEKKTTTGSG